MKPIQPVLRLWAQKDRQRSYRVTAVGEELNLVVRLQSLGLQQLVQPSPQLDVVVVNEGEVLGTAFGDDTLADDDLKPTF
jgi:hypothetical protein